MNIVDELHAIAAALRRAGVPYAVCGGIAVTAHGVTRSTKDIDVAIAREHLAAALAAVAPLGYSILAAPMTFGAGTDKERHVQRVNKIVGSHHLVLDLLLAEGVYAGILDDRIDVALPAGTVRGPNGQARWMTREKCSQPPEVVGDSGPQRRGEEASLQERTRHGPLRTGSQTTDEVAHADAAAAARRALALREDRCRGLQSSNEPGRSS